ncbi:hypothetical protein ACPUVO_12805 [Pseudocolwellia sp. HL-MZ19]|uniref:hypothetical protein n=1 Tax=unclassified Pseudocolwellia TaxID=2848178 RepID=UPI003CF7A672
MKLHKLTYKTDSLDESKSEVLFESMHTNKLIAFAEQFAKDLGLTDMTWESLQESRAEDNKFTKQLKLSEKVYLVIK